MTRTNHTIPLPLKNQIEQQLAKSHLLQAIETLSTIPSYEIIAIKLKRRYSRIREKESKELVITTQSDADYNQLTEDIINLISGEDAKLSQSLAALLPSLPPNYIQREEFADIEEALLNQSERCYGITGMEGSGKTVLATALAHSKKIQIAYEGAIFWVGIGQQSQQKFIDPSPIPYQEQLYMQLAPDADPEDFDKWTEGLIRLQQFARKQLADKKCLIIVDYVHGVENLLEAIDIHENAVMLVTTTDASMLRARGVKKQFEWRIGGMNEQQALQLFRAWSETADDDHPKEALEIVRKLGHHPLAIVMTGASVKGAVDPDAAWSDVLEIIKDCALEEFSLPSAGDLHSLFKLSLGRLNDDERKRFFDLCIFPENWHFTMANFIVIWNELSDRKVRRFVQTLVDKALLQQTGDDRFALYNLPRLYMRTQIQDAVPVFNRIVPRLMPNKPALIVAIAWEDESMARHLLRQPGINVDEETVEALIPLQVAAIKGSAVMAQLLLEHGASINQQNKNLKTALILAAQFGQTAVADILIKHGADVNMQESFGFTALHEASELGYVEIVRLLLAGKAIANLPDNLKFSPLYHAASLGQLNTVLELLKHAPVATYFTHPHATPLTMAAHNSHIPVMQALLDAGEDINRHTPGDGTTLLHNMAFDGNATVAAFVIKSGAMLDAQDNNQLTPMHYAAQKNSADVIRLLVDAGANIEAHDVKLFSPLHHAVRKLHKDAAVALIQRGANVNAATNIGITPLHIAASNLNKELVQLLIAASVNINQLANDGNTALHFALSQRGHLIVSSVSQTASFSFSEEGMSFGSATVTNFDDGLEVIRLLVENGASLDAPGNQGLYPLHFAIVHADVESVKIMIEAGASLQIKDPSGRSLTEFTTLVLNSPIAPQLKTQVQQILELL